MTAKFSEAAHLYKSGDLEGARDLLEVLLRSEPNNVNALHLLGLVLRDTGNLGASLARIQRVIEIDPGIDAAQANLGTVFVRLGRLDEACAAFRAAISINPVMAEAWTNLGSALGRCGRHAEAIEAQRSAIKISPGSAKIQNNLAVELMRVGDFDEAISCLNSALESQPGLLEPHYNLGRAFHDRGDNQSALAAFDRCLTHHPGSVRGRWGRLMTLPAVYDSETEIDEHRQRFEKELGHLEEFLTLTTPVQLRDAVLAASDMTNFYLHYQGRNECELQARFGSLLHRIGVAAFPQFQELPYVSDRSTRARIRVGLVSNTFHNHTLSKLFGGWIEHIDHRLVELHVFHTGPKLDENTEKIRRCSDHYLNISGDNLLIIEAIRRASLDVLVFLDIGMDPRQQILAPLRLAPVQCTTWAHPVTSGIPSIEYFLSSELMEPDNGEDHYTEKLVRLPNLGIYYSPVSRQEARSKPEVDTGGNRPIYLCSQSLFKLLPQHDDLFVQIAKRAGRCSIWFISAISASLTRRFQRRLACAFEASGLDAEDYVRIFDRMSEEQFITLNRSADVILDSHLWSGGNTSLEALACGRPIVTCPGPTMRGCHTSGILKMANLEQLIAHDVEQYVDIAVRLGTDNDFRHVIAQDIQSNANLVFNDVESIRALERFLVNLVTR